MKTNVQTFCQEVSSELNPFAQRLGEGLGELSGQGDLSSLNSTLLGLREVQHRLATLQDKIDGQQAFLLIFGPLKSGKSTLMNAISGAYVSEVSSLPAYPALVYVKNGDQTRFQATTYEGQKRSFRDNMEMSDAVQQDHARLAEAIVATEREGGEFDPKQHYPQAIRRIDVEVPARELADSGTVLVDTPGLYSKMRFGYDQMTRDFRDTAACAIFVVKTDNLFFEKVFEEFEELLGCFSRIFLVSNIDTSKKDLKPDGTLEASLESREPGKIIDAFRSLSMSASLRGAIEDGRLQIYTIDLLKAASQRLRRNAGLADEAEGEDSPALGFDQFLDDLTNYLNSSDYLNDFMFDSLRVGRELAQEARQFCGSQTADDLERSASQLKLDLDQDRQRLTALEELDQADWRAAFAHLQEEKDRFLANISSDHSERLAQALQDEVDAWMQTDESWNDLLERRLNGHLANETRDDMQSVNQKLRGLVDSSQGGARFSSTQQEALRQAGVSADDLFPALLANLGQDVSADTPRLDLPTDDIPLKRGFLDFLLLRSHKQLHMHFFGNQGEQAIPAHSKQKRLGGQGVAKIKELVAAFARETLPHLQSAHVTRVLDGYAAAFSAALLDKTRAQKALLQGSLGEGETRLRSREQAQRLLASLDSAAERFDQSLATLQEHYQVESREPVHEDMFALDQDGTLQEDSGLEGERLEVDYSEVDYSGLQSPAAEGDETQPLQSLDGDDSRKA